MTYCLNRTFLKEKGDANWPRCRDKRYKLGPSGLMGYMATPFMLIFRGFCLLHGILKIIPLKSYSLPKPEGYCLPSRNHGFGAGSRFQALVSLFAGTCQPCTLAMYHKRTRWSARNPNVIHMKNTFSQAHGHHSLLLLLSPSPLPLYFPLYLHA